MKKYLLSTVFFLGLCAAATAQSEKYTKAMQEKIIAVDTTHNTADLLSLSAAFERIADAEKTQWLPYYYAALSQVNAAYLMGQGSLPADKVDPMADKAEALLNKADALQPNNSENYVVKKMIASLRMVVDPMTRYQTYSAKAAEAMEIARKLNPQNPRIPLLEAQDKYYTPEQYGGSKTEAKKLLEDALVKFGSFKPAGPLDPVWGRQTAQYFLSQMK